MTTSAPSLRLFPELPSKVRQFPQIRYMGSKYKLLPWIHEVLSGLDFDSALDPFSGSGCVSYLMKAMGKQVTAADFLNFTRVLASATVANPGVGLTPADLDLLLSYDPRHKKFIENTFSDIFFTPDDLRFLDSLSWNIKKLRKPLKRDLATAAMIRSCAKRQPRGVFTVAGDPDRYKDGRRDLALSIREHFLEHVQVYNKALFDNGRNNRAVRADVFELGDTHYDLVYLDPPYVPRADDNCYIKRYHFLEGISCYWQGVELLPDTRVKKIRKPFTPFSYRRTAVDAFDQLFKNFTNSTIVLSYSSNGFPDLDRMLALLSRYKSDVQVHRREYRYHFGTHVAANRNEVEEYLIVGI